MLSLHHNDHSPQEMDRREQHKRGGEGYGKYQPACCRAPLPCCAHSCKQHTTHCHVQVCIIQHCMGYILGHSLTEREKVLASYCIIAPKLKNAPTQSACNLLVDLPTHLYMGKK